MAAGKTKICRASQQAGDQRAEVLVLVLVQRQSAAELGGARLQVKAVSWEILSCSGSQSFADLSLIR